MIEKKDVQTIFIAINVRKPGSPIIDTIQQRIYRIEINNCRCDIETDIEKDLLNLKEINKVIKRSNQFLVDGHTDFFTIMSDIHGHSHRFCFHLKYSFSNDTH